MHVVSTGELDAKQVAELARCDDQCGCGGEARHHGARKKIDEKAGPKKAKSSLNGTDHHAECRRDQDEVLGSYFRDGAHRRSHQDRVHGHRPDREMTRRTKDGVHQNRGHRCVESMDRREAGKERIAHRLGDQHHRRGQARDDIGAEVGSLVVAQPSHDRERRGGAAHPSIMAAACWSAVPPERPSRAFMNS